MLWLVLISAAVVLVLIVVTTVVPLRVCATARGKGEWGKTWVLAGGLEVLGFTLSVAAAHGVEHVVQLHFSRWRLHRRTFSLRSRDRPKDPKPIDLMANLNAFEKSVERWFDIAKLRTFAWTLRRFIKLKRFDGRLVYGLEDFALTGMSLGFFYTLAALAVPVGTFRVDPIWDEVTKGDGNVRLEVRLWLVRTLMSIVFFTIKNIKLRKPPPPGAKTLASPSNMESQHGR